MKRTDFKALVPDGLGPLIDRATGMVEGLRPLVMKVGRGVSRARHEFAQHLPTPGEAYRDLLPAASSTADFAKARQEHARA